MWLYGCVILLSLLSPVEHVEEPVEAEVKAQGDVDCGRVCRLKCGKVLLFVKKSRSSKVNQASKTNCSQRCGQKNSAKFVRSLFDDRLVSGEQAKYESFSARMQLSVNNNKKENFIMYISVLPG